MPQGPHGKSFPTIGYAGWAMFAASQHKEGLEADRLAVLEPRAISTGRSSCGVIPTHKGADKDPFFATEQFKGWFAELNDPRWVPTVMPTYLEEFGYFADVVAIQGGQEALLGKRTAADVAGEWATYLGDAQKKCWPPAEPIARRHPGPILARAGAAVRCPCSSSPTLCRAGADPDRPGDDPAADRRHRLFLPNMQLLNPFKTGWVGLQHFRELLHDPVFWHALLNTLWWTVALAGVPVPARAGPGPAARAAVPRPRARPGAGVPALGGAELPLRPDLGLAVQPGHRPAAALAVRARAAGRRRTTSWPIPHIAMWGPIIANVWWGIPFFAITLLAALQAIPRELYEAAAIDGAGALAAASGTSPCPSWRPTIAITVLLRTDLDRQLRRPDRRHDRRRAGRHAPRSSPATSSPPPSSGSTSAMPRPSSLALLLLLLLYAAVLIATAPQPDRSTDVSRGAMRLLGGTARYAGDPGLCARSRCSRCSGWSRSRSPRTSCSTARASACGRRRRR